MSTYEELFKLLLPAEIADCFDLVKVHTSTNKDGQEVIHLHLDELDFDEEDRGDLISNGFYNEQIVQDYPIRDKKCQLHIRRRRWKTPEGKTVSNDWNLKAKGTRMSKDYAERLKKIFGHIPDYGPLS